MAIYQITEFLVELLILFSVPIIINGFFPLLNYKHVGHQLMIFVNFFMSRIPLLLKSSVL